MHRQTRNSFKLRELSQEEINVFMDSVETDSEDGDFSDDDSFADPDFDPHLDEISPEDELAIHQHLQVGDNTETNLVHDFVQAINASLNLDDLPSASSTMHPILSLSHEEEVETEQPSTSTAVVRPAKRVRSPLPSFETTGPIVTPSTGGYTGTGK